MQNMDNLSLDEILEIAKNTRAISDRHTQSFSNVEACIDDDSASNEEENFQKGGHYYDLHAEHVRTDR